MKKILMSFVFLLAAGVAFPTDNTVPNSPSKSPLILAMRPGKEQQKLFKQRNKQIRQLTKQYRTAKTNEEKAAIKERLTQLVSQATDESMFWARMQLEAEKDNLVHWEAKLAEREKHLDKVKAKRVEEILSGEAEQRFKLAKKRWKKEMKDLKKSMK